VVPTPDRIAFFVAQDKVVSVPLTTSRARMTVDFALLDF
jgi:hypothetical protein